MKKTFFLLAYFFLTFNLSQAQDPTFSQYYNNPLFYNPGFTGIFPGLNINTSIRRQWSKIPSQYNTKSISADINNPCIKSGAGILLVDDNEGEGKLRTITVGLSFAYKIVNSKKFVLQFGAQACGVQKKIDWERLVFSDQINQYNSYVVSTSNYAPDNSKKYYPDFNGGIVAVFNAFHFKKNMKLSFSKRNYWLLGISYAHISEPNQALYGLESTLPHKLGIQLSFFKGLKDYNSDKNDNFIIPSFQWERQNEFRASMISLTAKFLGINLGISYRNQKLLIIGGHFDALIYDFDINLNKNDDTYKIGLSYDQTVSKMRTNTNGTIEISFKICSPKTSLICRGSSMSKKHIICPRF